MKFKAIMNYDLNTMVVFQQKWENAAESNSLKQQSRRAKPSEGELVCLELIS